MSDNVQVQPEAPVFDHSSGLYRHTKRKSWGLAILAWERDGKRGYQFEDGTLRVFKKGFYSFFTEVDPSEAPSSHVVEELNRRLERSLAREAAKQKAHQSTKDKPKQAPWSFEDQVSIFRQLYPGGFQDPKWLQKVRGVDIKRRLKRHRQPAIDAIREAFSLERLNTMIDAGQFNEVCAEVREQLKSVNLVSSSHIKPIERLTPLQQRAFALALRNLIHGEGPHSHRFEKFISTIQSSHGAPPNWQLATSIGALFDPENQLCVRPSAFRKQLPELAPGIHIGRVPNATTYRRLCKMARLLENKLRAADLPPTDMLDLHDFIWETLRPAAGKLLK